MTKESTQLILSEASSRYLATLTNSDRQNAQQELAKFVRWYGPERLLTDIRPVDIGNYAESLGVASVPDPTKRLEPVRAFLNYAKKEGLTGTNLAPHLRARKTTSKSKTPDNRMASTAPVHFTAAGLEKLKVGLGNLKHQRVKVAETLRHAMADKDFRENAPLDAAREEQGRLEARIRQLEPTL